MALMFTSVGLDETPRWIRRSCRGSAWDGAGDRLGRSAGYYDRIFARSDWRSFRCGIFFAAQEAAAIPSRGTCRWPQW